MKKLLFFIAILVYINISYGSDRTVIFNGFHPIPVQKIKVLVIDDGTDFTHKALIPYLDPNTAELNGTAAKDDDNNGYVDDIYGWNFVENSNVLVHLEYKPEDYDSIIQFWEVYEKYRNLGTAGLTTTEINYLNLHLNDATFVNRANYYMEWSHGTHVAGIVALDNPYVLLNAIAHLPVGEPPTAKLIEDAMEFIRYKRFQTRTLRARYTTEEIEATFKYLGNEYANAVDKEGKYIASFKPRIINCSFGTENSVLTVYVKGMMTQYFGYTDPGTVEVQNITDLFVKDALYPRDEALLGQAKDAIIFIAAENSSEDDDSFLSSPINSPLNCKIVVAATNDNNELASFSCYGKTSVDVAVPGVRIYSTYPCNEMGYMSGTSMACPLAARYACKVLSVDPDLTANELKKILLETVDKKSWLTDKVSSGGVINYQRAVKAAAYVKKMGKSVDEAISLVNSEVPDNSSNVRNINKRVIIPELERFSKKFAY